ncbi:hypothetical protein [Fibrobacter sp. UWP2]|uniref:hypothetical protein n=1 Tax=Fibrobacter sp. UWP2 TaxID=1896216 RepID=UPI000915EF1F|nr:hypothetical protein [Fibrobacter sp. UWP2]SHJ47378.1 hypothetical protein SAMN05720471_1455 [Fibrobacter sp. UWP2]
MKRAALIFVVLTSLMLAGCGSSANLVMITYDHFEPLSKEDKLLIVDATVVPVTPTNSVPIATITTNPETQCSVEAAMDFLVVKARELGANVLFVKKLQNMTVYRSYGVYGGTMKKCEAFVADFLYVKPEPSNEQ